MNTQPRCTELDDRLTLVRGAEGVFLCPRHDRYVGRSLLTYGEYCAAEAALLRRLIAPGAVVVEVGANIGAHTVVLARQAGPQGRVLAFEPQPQLYQILCANLVLNDLSNVTPERCALGEQDGELAMPVLDLSRDGNFGGAALGSGEAVTPVKRLDDLGLDSCQLIKADVEGMEAAVVRGGAELIARTRPVLYLEADRREAVHELLALLSDMSYEAWWFRIPMFVANNAFGVTEDIFPGVVHLNLMCFPAEAAITPPGFTRATSADQVAAFRE